ncbi:sigma-70 family RNA polymerase sigma factor [Candidatus Vidania fulgoroideorum]
MKNIRKLLSKKEEIVIFKKIEYFNKKIISIITLFPFIINSLIKIFNNSFYNSIKYEKFINYVYINKKNKILKIKSLYDKIFFNNKYYFIYELFFKIKKLFLNISMKKKESVYVIKKISNILSIFKYSESVFSYITKIFKTNIEKYIENEKNIYKYFFLNLNEEDAVFISNNILNIRLNKKIIYLIKKFFFANLYNKKLNFDIKKNLCLKKNFFYSTNYYKKFFALFINFFSYYRLQKRIMVESNLRLILSISKNYLNRGVNFNDLIQEGTIGLMKAIEKFNYRKGFKLSTYSTWWIKQSISRSISDQSRLIRIPVHMNENLNKIKFFISTHRNKYGKKPSLKLIEKKTGISLYKVEKVLNMSKSIVSLESRYNNDENFSLDEIIVDKNQKKIDEYTLIKETKNNIKNILLNIPEKESKIIKMRFGIGYKNFKTLEKIGKIFGVTRERIRQIESKAINRLKNMYVINIFSSILKGR